MHKFSISLPGDSPEVRETAERLTRGSGGRDDIFVTDRAGKILIFKSYSEPLKGFFENYKFFMGEYLGRFLRYVAENNVPCIRVFGLDDPQNILRVIEGDPMGTVVHP